SDVERLVDQYTTSSWDAQTISAFLKSLPQPGSVAREVLLIRLANELEDHLDYAALYSGAAEYRQEVIKSYLFQCVDIADKLGLPALASGLSQAFEETLSTDLPLAFLSGNINLTHNKTVHLICWKSSFLFPPETHALRLKVRLSRIFRRRLLARVCRFALPH
ncbi:MAG: hypothetical protein ND866_21245, partial [Pyrinomonadaceae bacterium]|nr:hypothetical protein [Pyrinomonadaceae bacterium]